MVHLPCLIPLPHEPPEGAEVPLRDRPYFVYVGRLEKLKGVQDLLRVFREYRGADLLIVGTGSYEPSLREQARGLDHVRFLGALHPEALGPLYRNAVATLVPSLCYETFGLTAAEAMSHGTPAIVRRIGALAENLEQSGGGLGFTTLEECREAMEALRTQPALRERLGRRGQDAVRRLWSPAVHLRQYLELADSLLARRSSRQAGPEIAAHA